MDAHVGAGTRLARASTTPRVPGRAYWAGAGVHHGRRRGGAVPGGPVPVPGPRRVRGGRRRGGQGRAGVHDVRPRPRPRGERMAAGTPGPGAYDVARPAAGAPGSPADAPAPRGHRADAQGPRGLGGFRPPGSAGKHSPGPAAYVSDAVARPHSAAPAYTMAARPSSPRDDVLGSTPGPGEYHADADADAEGGVRIRRRPPARSVPFAKEGRDVRRQARARRRVVPPGRERVQARPGAVPRHALSVGGARPRGGVHHPREVGFSRRDCSAPSDAPGPGEYYGEYREDDLAVLAGERRGVTIAGRTPAAGADAAPSGCVPGPAYYVGPWTRADLGAGPRFRSSRRWRRGATRRAARWTPSRATRTCPGRGTRARGVPVPDRGRAGGDRRPGGEFLWAPKGYTFGWHGAFGEQARGPRAGALDRRRRLARARRVPPGRRRRRRLRLRRPRRDALAPRARGHHRAARARTPVRRSRSSPGPGECYRAPDKSVGSAGARGPRRGARIEDRRAWEGACAAGDARGCARAHGLRRAERGRAAAR